MDSAIAPFLSDNIPSGFQVQSSTLYEDSTVIQIHTFILKRSIIACKEYCFHMFM